MCLSIILVVVVATKDGDGEGVEGREMRWEDGREGEGGRKIKREDVELELSEKIVLTTLHESFLVNPRLRRHLC